MPKAFAAGVIRMAVLVGLLLGPPSRAGEESPQPTTDTARQLGRLLATYCADCHSSEDPEGGLTLESAASLNPTREDRSRWQRVFRQVRFGAMPPADYDPLPTPEERAALLRLIEQRLNQADCDGGQPPSHVTVRRLNVAEYDNTLRDLLGVDFQPSKLVGLPDDDVGNGFDNQGEVLSFSPLLMEKYLDAAEEITRRVIVEEPTDAVRQTLLASPPARSQPPREALRDAIKGFLPRAYRRPVEANEVERLVDLGVAELHAGGSYPQALAASVSAALVSPNFLFRAETTADDGLSDHELASRLSYFLWASMPDEALFRQAEQRGLGEAAALRRQVVRMMADPRAESLAARFFAQWLGLHRLEHASPTQRLYRRWNTKLQVAMREETLRLVRHAIREDLSLFELFDARYTFVNPRLAELYGVDFDGNDPRELYLTGPGSPERERRERSQARHGLYDREDDWVRVDTPPGRRGLLTHASVLTLTSNPTRTSPVKRGHWVLETVLGDAPPPAPPDVPELEETAAEQPDLTLREQLALHRQDPACAGCHQQMDPIGIAFENFDSIGAWREESDGSPIDAASELEGQSFNGPGELIALVREREEQIARHFAGRLLVYALGRGLTHQDRCAVDGIIATAKDDDYRLSAFLGEIVTSPGFRNRGVDGGAPQNPKDSHGLGDG